MRRAAAEVGEGDVRVDAQVFEHRGVQVARRERVIFRAFAAASVLPMSRPPFTPPPAMKHRHRVAPVVAARRSLASRRAAVAAVVHLRRAAELAAQQHHRRVEQAALVEVFEQGRDHLVDDRQVAVVAALQVPVMVPAAAMHGDERAAGLDQPARQQRALAPRVAAVAIAGLVVFLAQMSKASMARSPVTSS